MILRNIHLVDFRNIKETRIELAGGLNVFFGENAQGKTNLLESVYLSALGRSHRGAADAEMVRWGCDMAYTGVRVQKEDRTGSVEMRLFREGKKRVLVEGVPISRLVDLMGALLVVMFSPEDLQLVKEGPAFRRRYMDTLLCQARPAYLFDLQVYNRALAQRNRLLQRGSTEAMEGFDAQLCGAGARILAAREKLVGLLGPLCAKEHAALFGGEALGLEYRTGIDARPGDEREYLSALRARLQADLRRGHTTRGVHRDDVRITVNGADARRFASQGQQRSAALSLRLGQCAAMEALIKKRPVLLLDDVLSELDATRSCRLLERLGGGQALLTCTAPVEGAKASFAVKEGRAKRIDGA
jgi:DNA replication and repair protein RecF